MTSSHDHDFGAGLRFSRDYPDIMLCIRNEGRPFSMLCVWMPTEDLPRTYYIHDIHLQQDSSRQPERPGCPDTNTQPLYIYRGYTVTGVSDEERSSIGGPVGGSYTTAWGGQARAMKRAPPSKGRSVTPRHGVGGRLPRG